MKLKKKHWILIGGAVFAVAILGAAVVTHVNRVRFYGQHYFPNTVINGMNCGEMDVVAAAAMLDGQVGQYSLQIFGRDIEGETVELGVITADAIGLRLADAKTAADEILAQQDERQWILAQGNSQYSYSVVQGVAYDEELLRTELEELDALQYKNMKVPQDARLGEYSEEEGVYHIVPEIEGTKLDKDMVFDCVAAAIYANAESVDLEEQGCYLKAEVTAENEELLAVLGEVNQWLATEITYDWNGSEVLLDKNTLQEWISLENGVPTLDEAAVAAFVEENAKANDTFRQKRNFVTTAGVELTLGSGAFGWKTDQEAETEALIELIKQGSVTEREPVYSSKAPQKGKNDIGSSYVEADLTNQHLYLYHKGELIFETDFVSGDMRKADCVTPQGVFGLTYKTTNAVLRGADYVTPVSYWMPFHGNYGMHDATWRTEFGGQIYQTNGSHGCINLPLESAAFIYGYLYKGYPVICYY